MNQLNHAFTLFLSLLVEAMPFLLLGVLFSSALLLFIDENKLISILPRNPFLGALIGSCIGFLFPVCECGNVPVARRLLLQGAPTSVAIGFLLAAPTINPIVIWSTWIAFRDQPEIVFLRVLFSLIIATIVGWVFSSTQDIKHLLQPSLLKAQIIPSYQVEKDTPMLLQSGTFLLGTSGGTIKMDNTFFMSNSAGVINKRRPLDKLNLMLENTLQELKELGAVLVMGSAIAAIIQVAAPRDLILALGQGPITSIIAMMILAGLVSICSTVDSFFALSFAASFTSGSLLSFLVFGPMIDIKGIGLMLSIFQPKAIIYIFALAAQLTFFLTLIMNLYIS